MRSKVWAAVVGHSGSVEEGLRLLDTEVASDDVVLPEAPSDEEKYWYIDTKRWFIVGYGIASSVPLAVGMWLFVFASVDFFWFGAPAFFISAYLLASYFGVAVWGKDFKLDEHAAVLKRARSIVETPTVDVYLPCCGEPLSVLQNTYNHVAALEYDKSKLTVYVLDDSGKETVRQLALSHGFKYICREDRPYMKKAGNLRWAFARTHGDFILILDADFCPRSDFLQETVPYMFEDVTTAIVQTPQYFRYRKEQTWIEQAAGVQQEVFYRIVQVNRQVHQAAICVGTSALYRRAALAPFGGTALIGYSEDMHTGFNVTTAGWNVKYVPLCLSMGTCPDTCKAYFTQSLRWCLGSTTLLLTGEFWTSSLSVLQKLSYATGFGYYVATAMSMFVSPLPSIMLILFKPDSIYWYNMVFAIPSILFPFVGMKYWCRQHYGLECMRIRSVQYMAHFHAIMDKLLGTQLPWVPTSIAGARGGKTRYNLAMRILVNWTCITLLAIWAGSAWRMQQYPAINFVPTLMLESFNAWLALSIFYE